MPELAKVDGTTARFEEQQLVEVFEEDGRGLMDCAEDGLELSHP